MAYSNAIRLLYAGIAVIVLAATFFLGYENGRQGAGLPSGLSAVCPDRYQQGYDDAHKKLLDSGLLGGKQDQSPVVTGAVTAVGADSITIASDSVSPDPLADVPPAERTVNGLAKTEIVLRVQKTPEEMSEDLKAFTAAMAKPGTAPPPAPTSFKETAAALATIAVGDTVEVTSAGGADILYSSTIASPAKIAVIKKAQ